jgi:hypothetical protein
LGGIESLLKVHQSLCNMMGVSRFSFKKRRRGTDISPKNSVSDQVIGWTLGDTHGLEEGKGALRNTGLSKQGVEFGASRAFLSLSGLLNGG